MRFGLQLHGTLPLAAFGPLAAEAERHGFEDVTFHDTLMRRPVWPVLCDIARATRTVLVGPNVTHPFLQHPAVIAANLAHLDEVSDGRAVLGIGRGSLYGLVAQAHRGTLRGVAEAVHVIRMLVRGAPGTWSGVEFGLGPGQGLKFGTRRDVPVYLGTFGPAGCRLAGEIAQGVRAAAQWDPSYMLLVREWVREGAERAGRSPDEVDLVVENWTCLHPDRERARRHARRVVATFLPELGPMLDFYAIPTEEVEAARRATVHGDERGFERISDATIDRFMAAGDADDLRRGLDRIADAGFETVSFSGILGPEPAVALGMLGDEVAARRVGA
jgi:5,10-methylenetetrahydromethanopterin reductase